MSPRSLLWQYKGLQAPPEFTGPETTTVDRWFQPLSEPVRRSAGILAAAALLASGAVFVAEPSDFPAPPETITLDKWFVELSRPTLPPLPRQAAGEAAPPAFFGPEVTSLDKWFQPFSEPVRVKPPLPIAAYPSTWDDPDALTQPEATSLDKWYMPLSEPVLPLPPRQIAGESSPTGFPSFLTGPGPFAIEWWTPLSEPVLPRSSHAAIVASGENHANEILPTPGIETITLDKWFQPLSEPVRTTPPLSVGAMPSFEMDADSLTRPEATTLDKWFIPFSEPVREGPARIAHLYSGPIDDVNIWPSPEVVTLDKWYMPLSLPTLPRVTFAHLMAGAFDANETLPTPEVVAAFDANLRLGYHEIAGIGGTPSLGGR